MEFCPYCNIGLSTPERVGGYCNNCGRDTKSNNMAYTYELDKALKNKDALIQCLNNQVDSLKAENEKLAALVKELIGMAEDGYKLHVSNACHSEFLKEDRELLAKAREVIQNRTFTKINGYE